MKLVPVKSWDCAERFSELGILIDYSAVQDILKKRVQTSRLLRHIYGTGDLTASNFDLILALGDPKGKTILDLGCGSVNSHDGTRVARALRMYEPWLLRGLHLLGARCIGVDIGGLEGEHFEGHKRDLFQENALDFLPDASVDIATAHAFFDSPVLTFGYSSIGSRTFEQLVPQLERVVKPEGYFIFEATWSGHD